MTVHMKGKRYTLPDVIKFGDSSLISPQFFYEVIDFRAPKAGEWYISGAIPQAYQAPNDLGIEFLIAKKTQQAVQRTAWVPA